MVTLSRRHLVTVLVIITQLPAEAGWLRHNKNSKLLRQLVSGPGVAHFKASSKKQSTF